MSADDGKLDDLARRITDGEEVDWDAEIAAAAGEDAEVVRGLRVLAQLASAHRGALAGESGEALTRASEHGEAPRRIDSYYLLGFVGGIVSLGIIGFVVGPFVLVLLAEALSFASEKMREHNRASGAGA